MRWGSMISTDENFSGRVEIVEYGSGGDGISAHRRKRFYTATENGTNRIVADWDDSYEARDIHEFNRNPRTGKFFYLPGRQNAAVKIENGKLTAVKVEE